MNSTRITLIASLAVALVGHNVQAQTISSEVWFGTALPTTANELSREEVVREMLAALAQPQANPEIWMGTAAAAGIAPTTDKRSDVAADFNLYRRSGLSDVNMDSFNPYGANEQLRLQAYERSRNGPEFVLERSRIEGATAATQAGEDSVFASGIE